jgi:probable rRNA maturation factor
MSASAREVTHPEINVRNVQRKVQIDRSALQAFAEQALQLCLRIPPNGLLRLNQLGEIFVLLVSDRRISGLHRQYLSKSGPTDVITFEHGEIFISAETAQRHARQFGSSLLRELQLYVVHGLLHLHGFDDQNKVDARKMEKTQQRILAAACKDKSD